jgi:hypothetical protein
MENLFSQASYNASLDPSKSDADLTAGQTIVGVTPDPNAATPKSSS